MSKLVYFISLMFLVVGGYVYLTLPQPLRVKVREIDSGVLEKTVVNTRAGTVKSCRRAQLSPQIGGRINRWPVRKGMTIHEGDLLLELWNEDITASLTLAEREVEAVEARAKAVCLQADIAERDAKRYRELDRVGAASKERVDEALTTSKIRRAECHAAQAEIKVSLDQVALARANLDKTRLYAPFDGTIAALNGELGEYVTPSPPGIQTLPIIDLIDTSCYYVAAPIDEVDAPFVRPGMDARLTLDAFRGRVFAGRVRRVADVVLDLEKQARTLEIEVDFLDSEEAKGLLAGYSADAEVVVETRHGVLRAPTEAIVDNHLVYVFDPGREIIEKRDVVLGLTTWGVTEIVSGAREGELVVISSDGKALGDGAAAIREEPENE